MIAIAPSILAADFSRLGDEVLATERAGANRIHVDVMDGHFVPNLSMGSVVVKGLRPITKIPLEVHMMVENPDLFLEGFLKAGADRIIVHQEVLKDPQPLFKKVRDAGKSVGMAINPETPVDALEKYLSMIDLALCMTVHPGFGGQSYIENSPERIAQLREMIQKHNPSCELEVDGGVDMTTASISVNAGANVLVMGTALFKYPEGPEAAIQQVKAKVNSA